ncbi:MAG: low molecular weight protein-tyrosine-phosphatase [Rhodothermia bacterium]
MPLRILFVCLGNICRSPLAEGVFRKHVAEAGLGGDVEADSAGTGAWHVGEPPDRRMRQTASRHGVYLDDIRARKFDRVDLDRFDLIIAMDRSNLQDILGMASPQQRSKVKLFRSYDESGGGQGDVPDPYYGGPDGFEHVFEIVERTSRNILSSVSK